MLMHNGIRLPQNGPNTVYSYKVYFSILAMMTFLTNLKYMQGRNQNLFTWGPRGLRGPMSKRGQMFDPNKGDLLSS